MPKTTSKKTTKVVKKNTKKAAQKATKKVAKTTTKKSAKKNTTKKTTTKSGKAKQNFKALVCATNGECFWTTDGAVLKDLNELSLAFARMDDEVFLHHVNKERNDFADWVEKVLEDDACAHDLRKAKKPTSAKTVVVKHLKYYQI